MSDKRYVNYNNMYSIITAIKNQGYSKVIALKSDETDGLYSLHDIMQSMKTNDCNHAFVPYLVADVTNDWKIGYEPANTSDQSNCKFFFRKRAVGGDTWQEVGFCVKIAARTGGGINGTFYPNVYFKNCHIYRITLSGQTRWFLESDGLFLKNQTISTYTSAVYNVSPIACIYDGLNSTYVKQGMDDLNIDFMIGTGSVEGSLGHNENAGSFAVAFSTSGYMNIKDGAAQMVIPTNNNKPYTSLINNCLPFMNRLFEQLNLNEGYEYSRVYVKSNNGWSESGSTNIGVRNDEMFLPTWTGAAELYV